MIWSCSVKSFSSNKSEEKFKSHLSEEEKSSKKIQRNLYYSTSPVYNENPSPIDIKTKKFYDKLKNEEKNIKNKHNKNLDKYLNTPSTVNKHFFYRNNSNYTKYLNKDITNINDNDIKSYNYKEFKKNSEIFKEEIDSQKDNISENEKDSENKNIVMSDNEFQDELIEEITKLNKKEKEGCIEGIIGKVCFFNDENKYLVKINYKNTQIIKLENEKKNTADNHSLLFIGKKILFRL